MFKLKQKTVEFLREMYIFGMIGFANYIIAIIVLPDEPAGTGADYWLWFFGFVLFLIGLAVVGAHIVAKHSVDQWEHGVDWAINQTAGLLARRATQDDKLLDGLLNAMESTGVDVSDIRSLEKKDTVQCPQCFTEYPKFDFQENFILKHGICMKCDIDTTNNFD
ncbi:MAG: hypothetical protein BV459_01865 [Thermoplasmata archaeon M11B2D]|nr:MAG: hypothetical protein BV459_01865 [Thermoplasmata archaeon M11B2D]